ncbi:MAG TPA: PAS domain-containing protein [Bacteroidia bacterium]|jgi:PAS domain-containing protein
MDDRGINEGFKQEGLTADQAIVTHLFDSQPDAILWYVPCFENDNADSKPVDFRIGYCNLAASQALKLPKSKVTGSLLRSTNIIEEELRLKIWEQCLQVWESGESLEFSYYHPESQKHFNVHRSKIQGGLLSVTRDHTSIVYIHKEKEEQSQLLNQIIESSPSGISLYEAIRNDRGKIVDFKLKLTNQKSADITAFSIEQLYKYTVKEIMLIRGQSNYFDIVCRVTETGEPVYTEYYAEARRQWVALSILKFNDGYLLNYNDITKTKSLEKIAKDQADMLNSILNASITGLITFQAIYDNAGRISDFKFILLNDAAEKLLGISKEDTTKTYLTLFPNAKTTGFFELYKNVLLTGESVSKEFFYKGEGYNGWYYISVSKMNSDSLVQSFADITKTREPQS